MAFIGYHPQSPYLIPPTSFYDFYNLTMASVDFEEGEMDKEVVSQITFRDLMNSGYQDPGSSKPTKIPFYIFSGLEPLMQSLSKWGFTEYQLKRLEEKKIPGTDKPLISTKMMEYLRDPEKSRLRVSITAREEGRLAFPHEPLVIIKGPKWQVDIIEAAANNLIKNHTKLATIAAEYWMAAESPSGQRPELIDGSARRSGEWAELGPARSAYIAGWAGSSNEFAGEVYDIPTFGTVAHSFYMAAADELTANKKWMRHMPPVSLPDSRNTLEGMDAFLRACQESGVQPASARCDSDDPEWFIKTYSDKMWKHGFNPTKVRFTASNSLKMMDVYKIIHVQDLHYSSFIIGTHLGNLVQDTTESTVQKLAEVTGYVDGKKVEEPRDVIKIAKGKSSFPGVQDVVHMYEERPGKSDLFRGSVIVPAGMHLGENGRLDHEIISMSHPKNDERPEEGAQPFLEGTKYRYPNIEVMRDGKPIIQEFIDQDSRRAMEKARTKFFESIASLHPQHKSIIHPIPIGYGAEETLYQRQSRAIIEERLRTRRAQEALKKLHPAA